MTGNGTYTPMIHPSELESDAVDCLATTHHIFVKVHSHTFHVLACSLPSFCNFQIIPVMALFVKKEKNQKEFPDEPCKTSILEAKLSSQLFSEHHSHKTNEIIKAFV